MRASSFIQALLAITAVVALPTPQSLLKRGGDEESFHSDDISVPEDLDVLDIYKADGFAEEPIFASIQSKYEVLHEALISHPTGSGLVGQKERLLARFDRDEYGLYNKYHELFVKQQQLPQALPEETSQLFHDSHALNIWLDGELNKETYDMKLDALEADPSKAADLAAAELEADIFYTQVDYQTANEMLDYSNEILKEASRGTDMNRMVLVQRMVQESSMMRTATLKYLNEAKAAKEAILAAAHVNEEMSLDFTDETRAMEDTPEAVDKLVTDEAEVLSGLSKEEIEGLSDAAKEGDKIGAEALEAFGKMVPRV